MKFEAGKRYTKPGEARRPFLVLFVDKKSVLVEWEQSKTRIVYCTGDFAGKWEELPPEKWIALFWRDEFENTVEVSTVYDSEEQVKKHCPSAFKYINVSE